METSRRTIDPATNRRTTGSRSEPPPTSTGGVITTATAYDVAGRAYQGTDPKGVVAQTGYDNANQVIQTIEDLGGLARTTNFTWTLDGQKSTMTAVNAVTGDQTTTWSFGTTLADSGVARNDLLRYIDYPDSVAGSDREAFTYNRLGEKQTFADQRGNVRTLVRDVLGRETNDCVTTLGSATDGAVLQIARTYEIRGMVATVTSFDSATPNSGTILNQCALSYNDFMQLTLEQQEHSGAVTGSSPSVGYAYATGAGGSNQIRFTNLIYPNGRNIQNSFGTSGGMNDLLNRIGTIQDVTSGTVDLASYIYLGLATPVRIIYPEPQVWLDLWGGVSGQFAGLDQFNRVIDQRWQSNINSTPTDIDRYQLGHDANSNPLYKANIVGTPNVAGGLDELYGTDTLNRLVQMQRGVLNAARTAITSTPARQMDWTLDPTGNWPAYVTQTAGTTDLNQGRTSNPVNEITGITASGGTPVWVTPAYDAAGNMTTMPQPGTPTSAFTAVYDAWKRMVSISAGGSAVGEYQYDGRHRRIIADTTETRHFYFTNAWQDIEQRVGSATTMDQQHVRGVRYIDELVCRDDATPQRLYACQDAIFSVTCLSDASGTPQQRFVYDPYGMDTVFTGAWAGTSDIYDWLYRNQGGRVDTATGLYNFRNRDYQPELGGWTRRDPSGYDVFLSLYQYSNSAPTNLVDPFGLKTIPIYETLPDLGLWMDQLMKHQYDEDVANRNVKSGARDEAQHLLEMMNDLKNLQGMAGNDCPTVKVHYVNGAVETFVKSLKQSECEDALYFGHAGEGFGPRSVEEALDLAKKAIADNIGKPFGDDDCRAPKYGLYGCFPGILMRSIPQKNRMPPRGFGTDKMQNIGDIANQFLDNYDDLVRRIQNACECCKGKLVLHLYIALSEGPPSKGNPKDAFGQWNLPRKVPE